jgi:putative ATP-grasp target RiPP
VKEPVMDSASGGLPWGMTRMTERLPVGPPGYDRVVLDPDTQLAVYYDAEGSPIEMGRHGTNFETKTVSMSGGSAGTDGGGPKPQVADDTNIDFQQD